MLKHQKQHKFDNTIFDLKAQLERNTSLLPADIRQHFGQRRYIPNLPATTKAAQD
jgi:hypothetical protein